MKEWSVELATIRETEFVPLAPRSKYKSSSRSSSEPLCKSPSGSRFRMPPRVFHVLATIVALSAPLSALPSSNQIASQYVLDSTTPQLQLVEPESATVSHLSEWSRQTKADFLHDVSENRLDEWTIVMGNEGGGPHTCTLRHSPAKH